MAASKRRNWFARAVDGKDPSVDSLIVIAFIATLGLIGLSGWDTVALRHEFSPVAYGAGFVAILGALGGAKTVRDRWSPQGEPPQLPDKQGGP